MTNLTYNFGGWWDFCSFFDKFWQLLYRNLAEMRQNGQFCAINFVLWFYLEWQGFTKKAPLLYFALVWFDTSLTRLVKTASYSISKFATGIKDDYKFCVNVQCWSLQKYGSSPSTRYTSGQVEIFLAIYKNIYKCFLDFNDFLIFLFSMPVRIVPRFYYIQYTILV